MSRRLKTQAIAGLAAVLTAVSFAALAVDNLDIADVPLLNSVAVDPNIMFVIDDSGSMSTETLGNDFLSGGRFAGPRYAFPTAVNTYGGSINPDNITVPDFDDDNPLNTAVRNAQSNPAYYNPEVTYQPWVNADGSLMPNADPTCARHQPFNARCRNLTIENGTDGENDPRNTDPDSDRYAEALFIAANGRVNGGTVSLSNNNNADFAANSEVIPFYPAIYYQRNANGSFTRVEIRDDGMTYPGGPGRTDCGDDGDPLTLADDADPTTCTYAQEIQNFANWYTYHRSRILIARFSVGRAFAGLDENRRVGFDRINNSVDSGTQPPPVVPIPQGTFSGENKSRFFNALYDHIVDGNTPLRRSLFKIGEYYTDSDNNGPWGPEVSIPGEANQQLSCRHSYTIIMSDGFVSDSRNFDPGVGNADKTGFGPRTGPGPDGVAGTADDDFFNYNPADDENLIFEDEQSDTLADIAFEYWSKDLREDLVDNVPSNNLDPAFWQHMTTFSVGFGTDGTLPFPDALGSVASGQGLAADNPDWPAVQSNSPTSVDDLWHAGVNGRGGYFNVTNSDEFTNSLNDALSGITLRREASGTSVGFSSGAVQTGTQVYQASYTGGVWTGDLQAFDLSTGTDEGQCDGSEPFGSVCTPAAWSAADNLDPNSPGFDDDARVLLTYNPLTQSGIPFRFDDLSLPQQAAFMMPNDAAGPAELTALARNRVNYLRGDISNQQDEDGENGIFRFRETVLGDIVNSSPLYVGAPSRFYPAEFTDQLGGPTPENDGQDYSTFMARLSDRAAIVYAGANDGFLHGFNAGRFDSNTGNFIRGNGDEVLGYMPAVILPETVALSDPDYFHRFFVDGPLAENDVFYDGEWHSVLVGSLGAGGQGLYALDISDPGQFGEGGNRPQNTVLWEFTDQGPADFSSQDTGFILSRPAIVRLHNGRWGVITGNGYNSTEQDGSASADGNARLLIIDVETGELITSIDTGVGFAEDPLGPGMNRPNGLGAVTPVDIDGDLTTDYVYAGDLFGNVWRFDLLSTNPDDWDIADFGTGTNQPFFVAEDDATPPNPQAITSAPQVAVHPSGIAFGVVVYFGTGKYFELNDATPDIDVTETFYGVYDTSLATIDGVPERPAAGIDRDDLLQQQFDETAQMNGEIFRRVTDLPLEGQLGWYIDLVVGNNNLGEMVVTDALVRGDDIVFVTFTPSGNPCQPGGDGFLVVLDRASGGRTAQSPFDTNNDEFNRINAEDLVDFDDPENPDVASAVSIPGGGSTPTLLVGKGNDISLISDFQGNIGTRILNLSAQVSGRETWRQLR